MRLPKFEHHQPATLEESLTLAAATGTEGAVIAGGTDLLANMKFGVVKPGQLISIRRLPELAEVGVDDSGDLRIGTCATLSDLEANPLIQDNYPALRDAIKSVGSVHIRNSATLGGNLCLPPRCWYYNQSQQWRHSLTNCLREGGEQCHAVKSSARCYAINNSDTAPILMALDAKVCLRRQDRERWLPLREFYCDDGTGHTVLEAGEILTHIVVPKAEAEERSVFIKLQLRQGLDYAVGSIGAVRKASGLTLVLNSVTSSPRILSDVAQLIGDQGNTEASRAEAATRSRKGLGVVTNLYTSAGYKRQIVEVLVKRALTQLA